MCCTGYSKDDGRWVELEINDNGALRCAQCLEDEAKAKEMIPRAEVESQIKYHSDLRDHFLKGGLDFAHEWNTHKSIVDVLEKLLKETK